MGAQLSWLEYLLDRQGVTGSNPVAPIDELIPSGLDRQGVTGSNPVARIVFMIAFLLIIMLSIAGCGGLGGSSGSSTTSTTLATSSTGLSIHVSGASTAITSLAIETPTQLFVTYRNSDGSTNPSLSTSSWFCETTIGTIPATGNSAGRFTGLYIGTGEVTAVTNLGVVTQEITIYDNQSAYVAPTIFSYLAYDFDAMWANWHKDSTSEAALNNFFSQTYFTDMADPFMSWFYWRTHTHTEGSMKWYVGSYDELQPVRAVADGLIVYANYGTEDFSNRVVTIEGVEYVDDIYVGLKVSYGSGSSDYVVAEYGHILCKKSIYDNSGVAVNDQSQTTEYGTGLSVNAGDIIGLWGNKRFDHDPVAYESNSFGGDFVVTDPQAVHQKLAKNHTNYNNVNPALFYSGANASSVSSIRTSLEALMQTEMKAPFVQPGGIGAIGTINQANKLWGYWYNKVQLDNGKQGSYFNMATVAFIAEAQTNSSTFTMPSSGVGLYCEDAADPGSTNGSEYWWDVQVFKDSQGSAFGSYCYTSFVFLESGDETSGVIRIVAPGSKSGSGFNLTSPLSTRYAKFEVVSTNSLDWRDDVLKIKYFDSLSAASAGTLSGSIYSDDNYYEFRKSLYGLNQEVFR